MRMQPARGRPNWSGCTDLNIDMHRLPLIILLTPLLAGCSSTQPIVSGSLSPQQVVSIERRAAKAMPNSRVWRIDAHISIDDDPRPHEVTVHYEPWFWEKRLGRFRTLTMPYRGVASWSSDCPQCRLPFVSHTRGLHDFAVVATQEKELPAFREFSFDSSTAFACPPSVPCGNVIEVVNAYRNRSFENPKGLKVNLYFVIAVRRTRESDRVHGQGLLYVRTGNKRAANGGLGGGQILILRKSEDGRWTLVSLSFWIN